MRLLRLDFSYLERFKNSMTLLEPMAGAIKLATASSLIHILLISRIFIVILSLIMMERWVMTSFKSELDSLADGITLLEMSSCCIDLFSPSTVKIAISEVAVSLHPEINKFVSELLIWSILATAIPPLLSKLLSEMSRWFMRRFSVRASQSEEHPKSPKMFDFNTSTSKSWSFYF